MFGEKVVSKVNFSPLAICEKTEQSSFDSYRNECCIQTAVVTLMEEISKSNLIFNCDFCSQGVVGVPLLSEGQTIF